MLQGLKEHHPKALISNETSKMCPGWEFKAATGGGGTELRRGGGDVVHHRREWSSGGGLVEAGRRDAEEGAMQRAPMRMELGRAHAAAGRSCGGGGVAEAIGRDGAQVADVRRRGEVAKLEWQT